MSVDNIYPILLTIGLIVFLILLIRLDRRISRGALDAGTRDRQRVRPLGQDVTPWELRNLHRQLRHHHDRHIIMDMVARLVTEAGLAHEPGLALSPDASDADLEAVILRLEQHLGLGPLKPLDR
jgi:hypothetical protein